MVDEQKLRQLAEAATPGPWSAVEKIGEWPSSGSFFLVSLAGVIGYWRGHKKSKNDIHWVLERKDAEYIAAANPAAILSLLDELQTLREERTALLANEQNLQAAVKQARVDALEDARKHCDELAGFLLCYRDKQGADLVAFVRDSIESLKGKP